MNDTAVTFVLTSRFIPSSRPHFRSHLVSIAFAFASWTALIPAVLGAIILISSLTGLKNQKIGVHIALAVAVLGILGTTTNVLQVGAQIAGEAGRPAAVITSTTTFVLLFVYVAIGIRSFIFVRRGKVVSA